MLHLQWFSVHSWWIWSWSRNASISEFAKCTDWLSDAIGCKLCINMDFNTDLCPTISVNLWTMECLEKTASNCPEQQSTHHSCCYRCCRFVIFTQMFSFFVCLILKYYFIDDKFLCRDINSATLIHITDLATLICRRQINVARSVGRNFFAENKKKNECRHFVHCLK